MYLRRIKNSLPSLSTKPVKWIVVANRAEARIYEDIEGKGTLQLLHTMRHPSGRMHSRELKEGRPGRSFASWVGSFSRHTMSTRLSPQEQDEKSFCLTIEHILSAERKAHKYDELILIAEPKFLGVLLSCFDRTTNRLVKQKIKKDLSHFSDREIDEYFHQHKLDLPG